MKRFVICILQIFSFDQIKKKEMGLTCGVYGGREADRGFWWKFCRREATWKT